MVASAKVAPWLYDRVMPYMYASAAAAVQQCSGGDDGQTCGMKWTQGSTWDGTYGVGQQMAALEVVSGTLIEQSKAPVSANTGGTSKGDPNAGTSGDGDSEGPPPMDRITTADKAGAGILTTLILLGTVGGGW